MSNNIISSIETLPVEILHRIFDNIDAETILLSIRSVCRLFRAVVNTYDRYILNFKSISKSNFSLFCRLINPQNVISLTLCDDEYTPNQIGLFISSFHLKQFTRLHSITFLGIEEFQLNMILKRINLNLLTSFTLNIRKYDYRRKKTTFNFLSSIIAKSNLRKIELNINNDRISNITWPVYCTIKYLIINENMNLNDICRILSCSPQLHTFIMKQNLCNMTTNIIQTTSFPQLTSLTIENLETTIDKLESFLLLTPSLIYLKLIGKGYLFDGKRWEQFIQINLPHLENFEFFMNGPILYTHTHNDIELVIESFRSPFWIEYKKWFVASQFNSLLYTIQIYSIPICTSILPYEFNSEKDFVSNSPMLLYNDPSIRININEISLSLNNAYINNKDTTITNILFPKVTKLHINLFDKISVDSIKFLTSIVDISQLVEVKLESYYCRKNNKNVLYDAINIIQQSYNLSSLTIHSRFSQYKLYPYLNDICSIIPPTIKHLQIPINQLDQIEIILERCPYLSVVEFEITRSKFSEEVIQWFNENTINSTFQRQSKRDIIWIGKKINEIKINHKRMKLNDDQFES